MRTRLSFLALAVVLGCSTQSADSGTGGGDARAGAAGSVSADLLADLGSVEQKLVDLARAIPAEKFAWRPGDGVRSVREVLLHVASDNYLLPAMIGFAPDPATGIVAGDYQTAAAFEARALEKDSVVAELEKSFAFLKTSLGATSAAKLGETVTMFGRDFTGQSAWILTVTHLHEHLGQLIAYARTNDVKPPWS